MYVCLYESKWEYTLFSVLVNRKANKLYMLSGTFEKKFYL